VPIDPRIPLGVEPVRFNSPFEQLAPLLAMQRQQQLMARDRQEDAQDALKRKQEQALRDLFASGSMKPSAIIGIVGPERGVAIVNALAALRKSGQTEFADTQTLVRKVLLGMNALPEGLRAEHYPAVRQKLVQDGVITEQDAPAQYDPQWFAQTMAFGQEPTKVGNREIKVRNADGSETVKIVKDEPGQSFESAAPESKAGTFEDYLDRYAKGKGKTVPQLSPLDVRTAKAEFDAAGRDPSAGGKLWVVRDGKTIRITEAQYQPGDTPASTREQGRPVTSGDATRIADFNTSLDDLKILRATVFPDAKVDASGNTTTTAATGTTAKVQASLPNWATALLGGWGTDAKQRQAVIDRVKQVIGKALEGGVLRKEDEYKYEKILPTISDVPDVVRSKLDGLEVAIQKRLGREIDALEDANYDVSKFRQRLSAAGAPSLDEGEEGVVNGIPAVWKTVNGVTGWYAK
jgi:hypothetical protein